MPLAAGTKLGRYEIRSKLGDGGMGEVYRAYDPTMHRGVAIRVLPRSLSADKDRLDPNVHEENKFACAPLPSETVR